MVLLTFGFLSIVTTIIAGPILTLNLGLLWCATHSTHNSTACITHHMSHTPPFLITPTIIDHFLMPPHIQELGPRCWDTRWATLSPPPHPISAGMKMAPNMKGKGCTQVSSNYHITQVSEHHPGPWTLWKQPGHTVQHHECPPPVCQWPTYMNTNANGCQKPWKPPWTPNWPKHWPGQPLWMWAAHPTSNLAPSLVVIGCLPVRIWRCLKSSDAFRIQSPNLKTTQPSNLQPVSLFWNLETPDSDKSEQVWAPNGYKHICSYITLCTVNFILPLPQNNLYR